jgi:hypothetical protein
MSDEIKMIVGRILKARMFLSTSSAPKIKREPLSEKPMSPVMTIRAASKTCRPGPVLRISRAKSAWSPTPQRTRRQSIFLLFSDKSQARAIKKASPKKLVRRDRNNRLSFRFKSWI